MGIMEILPAAGLREGRKIEEDKSPGRSHIRNPPDNLTRLEQLQRRCRALEKKREGFDIQTVF